MEGVPVVRFAIGLGWVALIVWLILPRSQERRVLTPVLTMLMVLLTLLWVGSR